MPSQPVPATHRRSRLWKCPRCGARFVTRNLWHSCNRLTVRDFLKGKPERGVRLFRHFLKEYRKIGPVTLHPVKSRIAFMVKIRFSGVDRIGKDSIGGAFLLTEPHPAGIFRRIEFIPPSYYVHRFTIRDETDINPEFRRFMNMAYAVGERKHLKPKGRIPREGAERHR